MDNARRKSGKRRRRRAREGHDYFEFADDDRKLPDDALEQRSVGLLVMFVVVLLLAVCFLLIIRSCEVETFPI
jgi:signal peptidase I